MNYQDFKNLKPAFSSNNDFPVQGKPGYNSEDIEKMKALIKKNREIEEEWESKRNNNGCVV